MALFITQVENWDSKRPEVYKKGAWGEHVNYVAWGDYYLLNTNRISDMVVNRNGDASFKYSQSRNDHRCSPDFIDTGSSVAVVEQWSNTAQASTDGTFPIFPNMDRTATPVDTTIDIDDIAMIYQTPRDVTRNIAHMVYYQEGFKRVLCLINMNILQVLAMVY